MKSELKGFSFNMPDGTERRGVDGCDNVVWDNGKCCVAVICQSENLSLHKQFRLDYGDQPLERSAGFALKHSQYFDELDPMTMRCIALQWVTHGGNVNHEH